MSYSFARKDASVVEGVKRIARQQAQGALDDLADGKLSDGEKVHTLRRRCKKLRGLLRLVRPGFSAYGRENASIRDAARLLGALRDSDVLVETLDTLVQDDKQLKDAALPVRTAFLERRNDAIDPEEQAGRLATFGEAMEAFLHRAGKWRFRETGFDLLAPGLSATFGELRRAMERAEAEPTSEHLHEWRKQVKYHWHHLSLLRDIAPPLIGARRELAARLGDQLGIHHDLSVLDAEIRRLGDTGKAARKRLRGAIAKRSESLAGEAFVIGHALAAERKSALTARHRVLWRNWRNGETLPALDAEEAGDGR